MQVEFKIVAENAAEAAAVANFIAQMGGAPTPAASDSSKKSRKTSSKTEEESAKTETSLSDAVDDLLGGDDKKPTPLAQVVNFDAAQVIEAVKKLRTANPAMAATMKTMVTALGVASVPELDQTGRNTFMAQIKPHLDAIKA